VKAGGYYCREKPLCADAFWDWRDSFLLEGWRGSEFISQIFEAKTDIVHADTCLAPFNIFLNSLIIRTFSANFSHVAWVIDFAFRCDATLCVRLFSDDTRIVT
jgi:hypothetical protein